MVASALVVTCSFAIVCSTLNGFSHAKDGHGKDALFTDFEYDAVDSYDEVPTIDGQGFLSDDTLGKENEYAKAYKDAPLFPHVTIDNFFREGAAKALLNDFPAFEKGNYLNEYGQPGLKSINTDIRAISPNFAKLWKYLGSEEFLRYVSQVTRIPDLLMDPTMFGGGCHENLNGQRLNTHIDFNYNREYRWHRRVNVLFYLNKDWDCAWGGCVTFETNPWCYTNYTCNTVKQYDVKYNRAVLFSTSEKSWHGFKDINAPASYKGTRKLISIYLYSRNRPENETAGAHSTHYIPNIQPPDESATFIKDYMKMEVDLNRQWQTSTRDHERFLFHRFVDIPQNRNHHYHILKAFNFYNDGWIANGAYLDIAVPPRITAPIAISLEGTLPDKAKNGFSLRLACYAEQGHRVVKIGDMRVTTLSELDAEIKVVTSLNHTKVDLAMGFVMTCVIKGSPQFATNLDRRELLLFGKKNLRFIFAL